MIRRLLPVPLVAALLFPACATGHSTSSASVAANATDDTTITVRVKTVLLNDTQINATKITVSTAHGVVTISGQVRSKAEEDRAVQLARGVGGVKDVKSTLQVTGGAGSAPTTLRF